MVRRELDRIDRGDDDGDGEEKKKVKRRDFLAYKSTGDFPTDAPRDLVRSCLFIISSSTHSPSIFNALEFCALISVYNLYLGDGGQHARGDFTSYLRRPCAFPHSNCEERHASFQLYI